MFSYYNAICRLPQAENLSLPSQGSKRPSQPACAAAPGNSRTVFVPSPSLARTRLFRGGNPRRASVFPGREKARACGEQFAHAPSRRRAVCNGRLVTRVAACNASAACKAVCPVCFFPASRTPAHLRWASRAPCLFLLRAAHARSWFRVRARAELLFFQAEKSPGASPTHRNARKAELCSFGFSGVSPASRRFAAEGPLKPASSQKKGGDQRKGAGVLLTHRNA